MRGRISTYEGATENAFGPNSIRVTDNFRRIPWDTAHLVIPGSYGQSMKKLYLSPFTGLQSLVIGSGCFTNISKLQLKNLNSLEYIKIGEISFFKKAILNVLSYLHIVDCPLLREIDIGMKSFTYSREFHLKQLPSLQFIRLRGGNFEQATDLMLIGREWLKIHFGYYSYYSYSLSNHLIDLPSLELVEFGPGTYCNCRCVVFQSNSHVIPHLIHFTLITPSIK